MFAVSIHCILLVTGVHSDMLLKIDKLFSENKCVLLTSLEIFWRCLKRKKYNWYTCFHTFVDIPLQLILTKMDKLDLCGLGDCSGIFKSRHAYKKVQLAKSIFGVHDSQILPIANYVDETRRSDIKDILALQAILNILHEAVTYIENI